MRSLQAALWARELHLAAGTRLQDRHSRILGGEAEHWSGERHRPESPHGGFLRSDPRYDDWWRDLSHLLRSLRRSRRAWVRLVPEGEPPPWDQEVLPGSNRRDQGNRGPQRFALLLHQSGLRRDWPEVQACLPSPSEPVWSHCSGLSPHWKQAGVRQCGWCESRPLSQRKSDWPVSWP